MGEIKSVKVDNWGVFFLQKLQNFFNKTDYCDLTLQFRDNSQLKVHRLVLSACTDYFNVLEQTCEVVDDAIIMPNGLQADVVVPIVNFMYTGTLEFELKMYNRLLRTAKDMNMTVLLKLLEAHRRTMEMHPQKTTAPPSPKPRRKPAQSGAVNLPTNAAGRTVIQTSQGKRLVIGSNANVSQRGNISGGNTLTRLPTAGQLPVRQIGSTTFTRIKVENEQHESNTSSSGSGAGYTILKQSPQQQAQQPTSPFEQLRKGYSNNKRPAVSTFVSPPAKKPNLEDVKEFAEQQRMRKQIAAEYGDDDYDASNIMDDDTIHNDDDDDEMVTSAGHTPQTSATSTSAGVQTVTSQSQQQQSEDPPGTTTILVKHEGPDKPPTIVVKDNSNTKMNHTKIISEVLRQYPHLVKSNKNIKLKIMPNAGGQAQKIIVKKEPLDSEKSQQQSSAKLENAAKASDGHQQQSVKSLAASIVANRPKTLQQHKPAEGAANSKQQQSGLNKSSVAAGTSTTTAVSGQPQKRRIDSKTMHALIALGAENTTGPWLCLRCGRNGHPISIPSYRGFRRHLINTHKETIDPALCEHCGWRSSSKRELHFHMQLEHKIKTNLYIFPECQLCQQMCIDSDGLNQHLIDSHPDENKQQCIYCNKIFPEEIQLYTHMKTFHKKQALEDGIIDYSDDENQAQAALPLPPADEYEEELEHVQKQQQKQPEKKVKILSDISLSIASSIIKTDSFVHQQESTTSVASEEYLQDQEQHQEQTQTKFVAADGSEVILTAEQRKEILSQLNQEHEGSGVVMMVNDENQQHPYASGETQSDQGAISHDETSQATTATNEDREDEEEEQVAEEEDDQHDDNQIYSEMKALHSNLEEDSTSQTEAAAEAEATNDDSLQEDQAEHELEHEEAEAEAGHVHLEESKESIDNLEWAENLISEHDLADEVSPLTTKENVNSNKTLEKEVKLKDDDKSQDEISKKLKELTGDWSEDDDEDMPDDEPLPTLSIKEVAKEKQDLRSEGDAEMAGAEEKETEAEAEAEEVAKEQEQEPEPEFEDHAELLASLQRSADKEDLDEDKEMRTDTPLAAVDDSENIDEDDIDMALKSLHKEDTEKEVKAVEREELPVKEEEEVRIKIEAAGEEGTLESSEEVNKTDEVKQEKSVDESKIVKDEEDEDNEKPEEKLAKELERIETPETACSTMEVDEETKKDLIESLLGGQAETMEDTAAETATTTVAATETSNKNELKDEKEEVKHDTAKAEETKSTLAESTPSLHDDCLNIATDKPADSEAIADIVDSTANTNATTTSSSTTLPDTPSSSVKDDATITSEERVKSLLSEWGDDDEDEDENDADLTANL